MNDTDKLKVAILGTGNIGTDLMIKVLRSSLLRCTLFAGRNLSSPGIEKAQSLGVKVSDLGIKAILNEPDCCEIVFDATSALDHKIHWPLLEKAGKKAIDMTPSRVGKMIIPAINITSALDCNNVNMVTCGGQASVPLAHLIGQTHDEVDYIEVVSSIASKSAGPATRMNMDEYIETTEQALKVHSGCKCAKSILILNPANPCVNMQTTVSAKVKKPNLDKLNSVFGDMVRKIQTYTPGYQVLVPPVWESNRIVILVRVIGAGDYLPTYAGNLDIINSAAIATAEEYARNKVKLAQAEL